MRQETRRTIRVALDERAYDIHVGEGLIARLGALVRDRFGRRRTFVVTDGPVAEQWLAPVRTALESEGLATSHLVIPGGEANKSFERLREIVNWLLDQRVDRGGLVIALGGGIVGDIAGFAAAVTLRGLDYVQVPTTLLAQVDSSVGGKTAINTPHGKNLVGSFHQPGLVVIDTRVLDTLPAREVRCGYAEVVKYGLIRDHRFFDWLEVNGPKVLAGDAEARLHAIVTSCSVKAEIVAGDEREEGGRALLNLGHTFGHALEAAAGFDGTLLHGEAVAVGMELALGLSHRLGLCPGQDVERARRHLAASGFATRIADIPGAGSWDAAGLIAHMRHDKKVRDGRMRFVLSRGIGDAFVTADVDEAVVADSLARSLGAPEPA